MATTTKKTYTESPYNDWNLPSNTSKIISSNLNSEMTDDFKMQNTLTTVTEDITYTGNLEEVITNTSTSMRTTGSEYFKTDLGEEIVNTTKSAFTQLAQPYMKAGQTLRIVGNDFEPDTEIRLYLDNQIISPVFSNIIYDDNERIETYKFSVYNSKNKKRYTKRPWVWEFCYDYRLKVWKFTHPSYLKNGVVFYYSTEQHKVTIEDNNKSPIEYSFDTNKWYYKLLDKEYIITEITDDKDMKWCEKVLRTPWFQKWLENQPEDIDIEKLKKINKIDFATNSELKSGYSDSKITIITDENGHFETEIKIPENTLTGNHIVTAETAIPISLSYNRYQKAEGSFKGMSYLRHWETVINKRKIEEVHKVVYRDITVTHDIQQIANITKNITYNTFEAKSEADLSSIVSINRWRDSRWDNDPVAQTFNVSTNQYLVGLDIYFSQIPDSSDTLSKPWVAIREVIDGNPSEKMMYYKELDRNTIVSADDPSKTDGYATRPTYIPFDYPIFVESNKTYAFTLGTNNGKKYFIYYSKMGEKDITTGNEVTYQKQQSFGGVMKISSNNSVWDNMQDCDVKYTLYKAKFDTSRKKTIYVDNINTNLKNFNSLNVSMGRAVFENTGVDLFYTLNYNNIEDRNNVWIPLSFEELKTFTYNDNYKDGMKLGLKIEMWTKDEDITPVINLDTLEVLVSKFKPFGEYIQNAFEVSGTPLTTLMTDKLANSHKIPVDNSELTNGAGYITSKDLGEYVTVGELSNVAKSGNYSDLKGRPNLSKVATSGSYNDLSNNPSLSTVATSGSYNDLSDKPNIPDINDIDTSNFLPKTGGTITGNLNVTGEIVGNKVYNDE